MDASCCNYMVKDVAKNEDCNNSRAYFYKVRWQDISFCKENLRTDNVFILNHYHGLHNRFLCKNHSSAGTNVDGIHSTPVRNSHPYIYYYRRIDGICYGICCTDDNYDSWQSCVSGNYYPAAGWMVFNYFAC